MKPRFLMKTAALLALAVSSTLALADDPPAQVGRIALTQGQVSISAGQGDAASTALVNWPVTSSNTVTTAPGARTELRVGSSAIRLDGDSSLDVIQLDDDNLRLRLYYGSVNVRIVNPEVLGGFELSTPQGRVLMQEAGRLRVDAELAADTSSINVFDGVAVVEGGGERLTVRAGRRADIAGPDLRTAQAVRDAFDDWALERDRQADSALATRYIPREMTGYEDLDRYGSWSSDSEYGNLWMPSVASTWVPYRDGRWTWIAPWGWTWVDNAPWGYAPFHYGRWVQVNRRWAWAPGHHERRPVWAPALVGWVGGAGWNLNFNSRPSAGQGWYPLAPHERFVPGYRLSDDHLRRLAWQAARGRDGKHDGKHDGKKRDYRREGLTVVPQDRFNGRREVVVPREPRATPPANWARAPVALPPTPPVKFGSIGQGANVRDAARAVAEDAARAAGRNDGRGDGRGELRGNARRDWNRDGLPDARADGRPDARPDYAGRGNQPVAVPTSPAVPTAPAASPLPAPPQAAVIGSSVPVIVGGGRERDRDDRMRQEPRGQFEDGRRNRFQQRAGSEAQVPRSAVPVLSGQPASVMSTQPAPERNWSRDMQRDAQRDAQREGQREAQREAPREAHRESPRFGSAGAMEAAAAAAAARAQQQARPVPTAISAPPPRAMPSPPPAPAPAPAIAAPAPSPAPSAAPERRPAPAVQPRNADDGGGRRGPARQMER